MLLSLEDLKILYYKSRVFLCIEKQLEASMPLFQSGAVGLMVIKGIGVAHIVIQKTVILKWHGKPGKTLQNIFPLISVAHTT